MVPNVSPKEMFTQPAAERCSLPIWNFFKTATASQNTNA